MKKAVFKRTKAIFFGLVFVQIFSLGVFAQKTKPKTVKPKTQAVKMPPKSTIDLPKVTQIDEIGLKTAVKTNGKPLLVNFWATWCDPCREEFPDLVKLDADYKGKIDFITVSLDDLAEINRDVPKFLADMKATMPAYLLKVEDEGAVIASITKDWQGGLPFTILYNENGEIAYFRQGKVKTETVRGEIEKLLGKINNSQTTTFQLPKIKPRAANEGISDAKNDIAKGILKIKKYGFGPGSAESTQYFKDKYGIEIADYGCTFSETPEYFKSYNETMKTEIIKRFGTEFAKNLPL